MKLSDLRYAVPVLGAIKLYEKQKQLKLNEEEISSLSLHRGKILIPEIGKMVGVSMILTNLVQQNAPSLVAGIVGTLSAALYALSVAHNLQLNKIYNSVERLKRLKKLDSYIETYLEENCQYLA